MEINLYQNLKNPSVSQSINIHDWLTQVKNSKHSKLIEHARTFGKGSVEYDSIKAKLIPCVTFNFLFKDKKTNANILGSTGFLYIDIDDSSFKPNNVLKSKVFAIYKSFGGEGYGVIVKVEGLTLQNYSETFDFIAKDLEIEKYLDKGAKKATQYSVLSYDPNIHVNNDCFLYKQRDLSTTPQSLNSIYNNTEREKKEKHLGTLWGCADKVRLDNFQELCGEKEFIILDKKCKFIKCWTPRFKKEVDRNHFLLGYCNNYVFLNPFLSKKEVLLVMISVNDSHLNPPVQLNQLKRVVDSIFKYLQQGSLKPIYHKKEMRIIFNKKCSLSPTERQSLLRTTMNQVKTDRSIGLLRDIITNWDLEKHGTISIKKIYKNFPISNKTVIKHYKLFTEEIKLKK